MLAKDGHEMPIGLSKVTIGFERVGSTARSATQRAIDCIRASHRSLYRPRPRIRWRRSSTCAS
jgi:hypothetical protein